MGAFGYFSLLLLAAVYRCGGDTDFNDYKTLHPNHVNLDWMKCIPDDKSLSSVSIPGTHQSLKSGGLNPYRNFQAWELVNQFYAGVRFVDMTLSTSVFGTLYVDNNAIIYREKFSHALSQLQIFLKDKKSETMLLRLTGTSDAISLAKEEINRATVEVWKNRKIPTMGEARGKIILMQSSDFDWGLQVNAMVLGTDEKEYQMKENIKKASEYCTREMMLTDNGAKGAMEKPQDVAVTLNKQLYAHLLSLNANKKPSCLGIIAMDFPGPKLIQLIINITCHLGSGTDRSSDTGLNGLVALNESTARPGPHQSGPTPGTTPKPEPVTTPGTSPKPNPVSTPGTPPKPEPVTTPGTPPKPEPVTTPGTPPKPEPVTTPGTPPKPEPVTSPKPEPVTTPGSTQKPEPVTTPGTTLKPEPVTTPGTTLKPEPVTTPGTPPKPEPVTTPGTPKPEPVTTPETTQKPNPVTTPAASSKPGRRRKKICRRVTRRKLSPLVS